MSKIESIQFDQYSSMGNNQTDFEACYTHTVGENFRYISHCHDFYELFLHLHGGRMMDIDQYYYEMRPNQLYIIPPFAMHGATVPPGADYERAFLYINSDTLKMSGCGQIDLDAYFQAKVTNGHHQFPLTEQEALTCRDMLLRLREGKPAGRGASFPVSGLLPAVAHSGNHLRIHAPRRAAAPHGCGVFRHSRYFNVHQRKLYEAAERGKPGPAVWRQRILPFS